MSELGYNMIYEISKVAQWTLPKESKYTSASNVTNYEFPVDFHTAVAIL